MAPIVMMTVRCNYCSKQRPAFRVHRMESGQIICDHCLEWHFHVLDFLGGAAPKGCSGCGSSWEKLRAEAPGVEARLYAVPKDGIYQLLCAVCAKAYVALRSDLYKGTEFGKQTLKLL